MTTKILMVCLGNICRSPLAQGILIKKVAKSTFVDSAGTAAYHIGNQPDPRSMNVGKKMVLISVASGLENSPKKISEILIISM